MADTMISEDLVREFFELVERGDEAKVREFLTSNIKRFPKESQDVIITVFFEEAIAKKNADDKLLADFQKEGVEMANAIERLKKELAGK